MAIVDPAVDPYLISAVAGVVGLWLVNKLLSTNPVPETEAKPFGKIDENGVLWANATFKQFHHTPLAGCCTVPAVMADSIAKYGSRRCVGKRPLLERHYEEFQGKEVEKLTFGESYDWMTYSEFGAAVGALGSAMVSMAGLKTGDTIVIYAETQLEWMLAAQAAFSQALRVATVYATLGMDGLTFGISQTKAKVIVCDARLLKIVASGLKENNVAMKHVTHIVFIKDQVLKPDPKAAAAIDSAKALIAKAGVKVVEIDDAIESGKVSPLSPVAPAPEDIAVVMYTSGTTGSPKGVLISHGNVVAGMVGMVDRLQPGGISIASGEGEAYLSYLPLAHIMEMICQCTIYCIGARVGFGSPHTLTPTSPKIKAGTCIGDAAALGPTLMVFAPAVLDKVYAGLMAKIKADKKIIQWLFAKGLAAGEANFAKGIIGAPWLYQKLLFKKVAALLGGKIKFAGTGSAPLAANAQMFVQTCFNSPVRQGYGLTETCGSSCVQNACDNSTGMVGPPTSSTVIMLKDWPEGNYLTADKDDPSIGMPRGEVLIGGPMVCQGYLVDPDDPDAEVIKKNENEFHEQFGIRWFHTGDVGQFTPLGQLQIIDRKKDLVKLQQGEYVALSKVENAMKACPLVELPMCYARSTASYCVALVCPSHAALKALGASMDLGTDVPELCKHPEIVKEVAKQCNAAVKGKLVGFEIPKKIGLVAETWTPESDLLTAAMKLKRKQICDAHKTQLDELYA